VKRRAGVIPNDRTQNQYKSFFFAKEKTLEKERALLKGGPGRASQGVAGKPWQGNSAS